MRITKSLLAKLKKHCTTELLSFIDIIELEDDGENTWDITPLIDDGRDLYLKLRVAYAFEQLGGTLTYKGQQNQFVIVSKDLDESICDRIRLFWINNEENGIIPIYDTNNLDIPPILPKYTYRPQEDCTFVVERLVFGVYHPIKGEVYLLEQNAKERTTQLNEENAHE